MSENVFVGRRKELALLENQMGKVLAGQGRVMFISGEAGSGKTALVNAFCSNIQSQVPDIVTVIGNCNAQGGLGDAYLPFREILSALTGTDVETQSQSRLRNIASRSAKVLVDVGPDLIETLVPGAALISRLGMMAAKFAGLEDQIEKLIKHKRNTSESNALEQSRIFEQYANVLKALAVEQTLILIIDDLHWVDDASAGLLFHLSRRLEKSSVFILGTYRPDEIALQRNNERHPMEKILSEIKRYQGEVVIELGQSQDDDKRTFVNQLLDTEPNHLDAAFREALYRHTSGHPLFTLELLRSLQERGDLIKDASSFWIIGETLNWNTLPARVEGVLEERLGRLLPNQRDLLHAASIDGEHFTADSVAQLQQLPLRSVLSELSQNIEKKHRLVKEESELKIGSKRLARYKFVHALFQRYLYDELGTSERRLLHGEMAKVLEEFYQDNLNQIAAQLAWHYDQAGEDLKAGEYYVVAAEQASKQGAPKEVKQLVERALEILPENAYKLKWRVLSEYREALIFLGETENQDKVHEQLIEIAQHIDESHLARAYIRQSVYFHSELENLEAITAIEKAILFAQRAGDRGREAMAIVQKLRLQNPSEEDRIKNIYRALTLANETEDLTVKTWVLVSHVGDYCMMWNFPIAIECFHRGLDFANQLKDSSSIVLASMRLGITYFTLGQFRNAESNLRQAIIHMDSFGYGNLFRAHVLNYLAVTHLYRNNSAPEWNYAYTLLNDSENLARGFSNSRLFRGFLNEQNGNFADALQNFQDAMASFIEFGDYNDAKECLAGIARIHLIQGVQELANQHAIELWQYLTQHNFDVFAFPVLAYLTCTNVFAAVGDTETSNAALEAGYKFLMERAEKITNPEWKKSYLENFPEHREIVAKWQALHHKG